MRTFATIVLLLVAQVLQAHPGIGIVEDSKGNIFFTDLARVWKITPDGRKSVAVDRVHTHELFIDDHDNLFGEHLWYNGEAADTWGHFVWKLSAAGVYAKVIPDQEGFREDYSFVRDHFGRMYWADRTGTCQHVARKNDDGTVTLLGDKCLGNIRNMAAGNEGDVLLVDSESLKRVAANGKVSVVADRLSSKSVAQFNLGEGHHLGGISQDTDGNIYVADLSGAAVKKIDKNGTVTIAAKTPFPWTPSGVLVTHNRDLWLLETTITNEVRVERITAGGLRTTF